MGLVLTTWTKALGFSRFSLIAVTVAVGPLESFSFTRRDSGCLETRLGVGGDLSSNMLMSLFVGGIGVEPKGLLPFVGLEATSSDALFFFRGYVMSTEPRRVCCPYSLIYEPLLETLELRGRVGDRSEWRGELVAGDNKGRCPVCIGLRDEDLEAARVAAMYESATLRSDCGGSRCFPTLRAAASAPFVPL